VEEKVFRHDDGFVYRREWWRTRLIEWTLSDIQALLDYIPLNIEEIHK